MKPRRVCKSSVMTKLTTKYGGGEQTKRSKNGGGSLEETLAKSAETGAFVNQIPASAQLVGAKSIPGRFHRLPDTDPEACFPNLLQPWARSYVPLYAAPLPGAFRDVLFLFVSSDKSTCRVLTYCLLTNLRVPDWRANSRAPNRVTILKAIEPLRTSMCRLYSEYRVLAIAIPSCSIPLDFDR